MTKRPTNAALLSQLRTVAGARRDASALIQEAIARRIGKRIPAGRYNLTRAIVVPGDGEHLRVTTRGHVVRDEVRDGTRYTTMIRRAAATVVETRKS